MKERHHVLIARPIEVLELVGDPRQLSRIQRNVRVDGDRKEIPKPEGVRHVSTQSPGRPFRRDQLRQRPERVMKAGRPSRVADWNRRGYIVVSQREKVRQPGTASQLLDNRREATVPLRAIGAIKSGVTGLQNEADGKGRAGERKRLRDHSIGKAVVLRLRRQTVDRTSCVAVHDERKARYAGGRGLRRKVDRRRFDRTNLDRLLRRSRNIEDADSGSDSSRERSQQATLRRQTGLVVGDRRCGGH